MKQTTLFVFVLSLISLFSQVTLSSDNLTIIIDDTQILSIQNDGIEVLNTSTTSTYFSLLIRNTITTTEQIVTPNDWDDVLITTYSDSVIINFSNCTTPDIPTSVTATVVIRYVNGKSFWNLSVLGLGISSLIESNFPLLNIKADGSDSFLLPYFSGKIVQNPGNEIDYMDDPSDNFDNLTGIYPRGFGATMQFLAYYNNDYGIYFGYQDKTASLKQFGVKNENGGVKVTCKFPAPNKTIANNNYVLPFEFQLDFFNGDWYDASLKYKHWASSQAEFWPQDSPEKNMRQQKIGKIGLWAYNYLSDISGNLNTHEIIINEFADFMDFPIGIHWYEWNYLDMDDDFPNYFPERTNLDTLVAHTQGQNENIFIMPYINGRMYDTDLTNYTINGFPNATKREDGTAYTQNFNSNTFAVMCPTQEIWQDTLVDATKQITDRIGTSGIYLDMIAAASPAPCMDSSHGHTLGGGDFWRTGHDEMFEKIHLEIDSSKFVTVEGGCDFLADEVDGFMVQSWMTQGLVPAFEAIYAGKLQLFGTQTGTSQYGNQRFYGRLSQGFSYGVQTGRVSIWLGLTLATANDDKLMAANYVKRLGQMRSKLSDFMSFGEMRRPMPILGVIPSLTFNITDAGVLFPETIPAIQTSVWQNGDSVVIVFVNGRIQTPANTPGGQLDFSFNFNGADYGMYGNLFIKEISSDSTFSKTSISNVFTKDVSLSNLELKAYIITQTAIPVDTTIYVSSCNPLDTGISIVTDTNFAGFDSTITTVTSFAPSYSDTIYQESCYENEVGVIVNDSVSFFGCDSIFTTIISLLPSYLDTIYIESCIEEELGTIINEQLTVLGCDSNIVIITHKQQYCDTTSIFHQNNDNTKIYPNPVFNFLQIDSKITINKIKVFSALGVKYFNIEDLKQKNYTLDVSSLSKGIYLIEIDNYTFKFYKD